MEHPNSPHLPDGQQLDQWFVAAQLQDDRPSL
jgi:hypothetical protein